MTTKRSQGSLTAEPRGSQPTGDRKAVLGQTSPREARQQNATVVRDIATGEIIACTNYRFVMLWGEERWTARAIADHFDADFDQVRCEDTDEGRFYSLDGRPVAYIEGEYEPLFELLQAAE